MLANGLGVTYLETHIFSLHPLYQNTGWTVYANESICSLGVNFGRMYCNRTICRTRFQPETESRSYIFKRPRRLHLRADDISAPHGDGCHFKRLQLQPTKCVLGSWTKKWSRGIDFRVYAAACAEFSCQSRCLLIWPRERSLEEAAAWYPHWENVRRILMLSRGVVWNKRGGRGLCCHQDTLASSVSSS